VQEIWDTSVFDFIGTIEGSKTGPGTESKGILVSIVSIGGSSSHLRSSVYSIPPSYNKREFNEVKTTPGPLSGFELLKRV